MRSQLKLGIRIIPAILIIWAELAQPKYIEYGPDPTHILIYIYMGVVSMVTKICNHGWLLSF